VGVALFRLLLALLLASGLGSVSAAAQTYPKFTGLVVDAANVLPPADRAALTERLDQLQRQTGRQLVVATVPSLGDYPIEDYGVGLLRAWGVGLKDANNGAILLVAPAERRVRVEVGTGLEPVLTDVFSERVIRERVLPRFRDDDLPGGVRAGADALAQQLALPDAEARTRAETAARDFRRTGQARRENGGGGLPFGLIFVGIVLAVVLVPMIGASGRRGVAGTRYRGARRQSGVGDAVADNLPVILWTAANVLASSGRERGGGWGGDGGGSGGGGWFDGGFTGGGGGSGAGGGASGEW